MNRPKDTATRLHNGNGSETSLQALLKTRQTPPDYDLTMEAKMAFIEKGISNGLGDTFTNWDRINMNITKMPVYNSVQLDELVTVKNGLAAQQVLNIDNVDRLQNGNQQGSDCMDSPGNQSQRMKMELSTGVTDSSDVSLSRSTEELSPEKWSHPPQVMKSHSVSNMETRVMKLYSFDGDGDEDCYDAASTTRVAVPGPGAQGQSIVRSKSAGQLLNDQNFQVYHGSSTSSSELLSSSKPPTSSRYPPSSSMGVPPPHYNIQYTSSAMSKDGLWAQRALVPPEHQGYLPHQPHSLANTNCSNRNQAPPYPQQREGPMTPKGDWTKEWLHSTGGQPRSSTLQRQSSSTSSVSMGEPRRIQVPDGEYMTYRDIHTLARGPLAMSQAMQRPFSTRTYSIDAPGASRPVSTRPQPHELPERTMSVSDFNYQHSSPSKRPPTWVKSEHSLLDGPAQVPGGVGPGRVPADWRDQVMRHIEAKKIEKVK